MTRVRIIDDFENDIDPDTFVDEIGRYIRTSG